MDTHSSPTIANAQFEIRQHFSGGFYGQLVSSLLWFLSAGLATFLSPSTGIGVLVIGGFFIFPLTQLLLKVFEKPKPLSKNNSLNFLGMQVAFVLPLSMPLLFPIAKFNLNLFYPAMMILLGAHYLPFVFLYGMRMFAVLCATLVGSGVMFAMYSNPSFQFGAWITAPILLIFAIVGKVTVNSENKQV